MLFGLVSSACIARGAGDGELHAVPNVLHVPVQLMCARARRVVLQRGAVGHLVVFVVFLWTKLRKCIKSLSAKPQRRKNNNTHSSTEVSDDVGPDCPTQSDQGCREDEVRHETLRSARKLSSRECQDLHGEVNILFCSLAIVTSGCMFCMSVLKVPI